MIVHVAEAAAALQAHDDILILTHRRPDGDTAGCAGALCRGLRQIGKRAYILENPEITRRYAPMITDCYPPDDFNPQYIVSTDIAEEKLFPDTAEQYKGRVDLVIDHHGSNEGFGAKNLIRADAGACAEVLYDVLTALGCRLTREIAECIYVGVSTDTGCFKFSSTKASTHITAAKLMEAGAHVEELNTLLFDTKSREQMEAERIARNHLEYHLDGRCALIYLTRDEIEQSRVDPADLEELTSLPISIEGVKVGLTLRQQPGGSYRISVRTAKGVDACAIARRLGGGGHTRAAGCELLGDLENTKNAILAEVEAELDAPQEEA